MDSNNTFALITGASSGMGLEFAKQLAQKGYNILMVSNEDAISTRANELQAIYPEQQIIPLVRDLSLPTAARELYDYCKQNNLTIEVLVNNAGVYHDIDILDDTEAFTTLIVNLHVLTPTLLCYLFGQDMRLRHEGYILNICSVTSKMAAQRLGTYGSTKAYLNNFTRSLHIELRKYHVGVTNVSPGAVDTGLYNIKPWQTKLGKCLGIIVSPQTLVRRALRAMFKRKYKVTIPAVFWHCLSFIILLIPVGVLRLIRRFNWF